MPKGMGNILKQAQKLQAKLAKMQQEMEQKTVEASAGGGMVTVVASGKMEVVSIRIEREVVDPDDVEMLQDLVLVATNEALNKAREMMASAMSEITGGLQIPGLL